MAVEPSAAAILALYEVGTGAPASLIVSALHWIERARAQNGGVRGEEQSDPGTDVSVGGWPKSHHSR